MVQWEGNLDRAKANGSNVVNRWSSWLLMNTQRDGRLLFHLTGTGMVVERKSES